MTAVPLSIRRMAALRASMPLGQGPMRTGRKPAGPEAHDLMMAEARSRVLAERLAISEARARDDWHGLALLQADNAAQRRQIAALDAACADETARADLAERWLDAVRRSTSWRLSAPLRILLRRAMPCRTQTPPPIVPPLPPVAEAPCEIAPVTRAHALRTVHQYHPGAARGDAITQSMLLIRGILRGLGYASDIYCEAPDPELGLGLRAAHALPLHGDYVLLVHFSLGFDGFDGIRQLKARKVLMYHNITPPELLSRSPVLQHYAELGRTQLPAWRGHVAAALADSAFNAVDLHRSGFDVVDTCPLLFDIEALCRDAGPMAVRHAKAAFTVLFVGRLVQSKAQDDLLEAFALFQARLGQPARLVLVGREPCAGDPFLRDLRARIRTLGLAGQVEFTGFVDAAGLRQCYRDADLYVSLSHHEGFGVPLIEAMAHGVPVLAWPCGAVPYTLGDAAETLDDRSADAVCARMLALAVDPGRRRRIQRRQTAALDRFRLKRHVPTLVRALVHAGARPPQDPALAQALAASMRFTLAGEASMPAAIRAALGPLRSASGPHVVISGPAPAAEHGDVDLAWLGPQDLPRSVAEARAVNARFDGILVDAAGALARALVECGITLPIHPIGPDPREAVVAAAIDCLLHRPAEAPRIAWIAGAQDCDRTLAARLAAEDPQVVAVDHHPDAMGWATLARLLASQALEGRVVAVTLRDTDDLACLAASERCDVLDALGRAARVIVRDGGQARLLSGWGVNGAVVMADDAERLELMLLGLLQEARMAQTEDAREALAQWRKWRMPVNTMATPAASAAATTSASRIDPPGWITAVAPAEMAACSPSANGKNASDATTLP